MRLGETDIDKKIPIKLKMRGTSGGGEADTEGKKTRGCVWTSKL